MIGLVQSLREMGYDVGCMKPVGQRYVVYQGLNVDEDVVLARHAFNLDDHPADMSSIAIERGFTERYIFHPDPKPLEERILAAYGRLRKAHDVLIVEGTGHAGVGSCFDLSNARVAELFGSRVVLITEGGIGRALDEAALSLHLFRKHGVEVVGVIQNKVWPEKLEKIQAAVAQGCLNMGTRLLGVVPFCEDLRHHRMEQALEVTGGTVLCGADALENRVDNTVVAAMSPQHVAQYLTPNTLVVTPGDRVDNILVSALTGAGDGGQAGPISGLVLTGGFEPAGTILQLLKGAGFPVILCKEDTYSVASQLRGMRFKIRAKDTDKIETAKRLVHERIDVAALIESLRRGEK
jgi:hypothetical protein